MINFEVKNDEGSALDDIDETVRMLVKHISWGRVDEAVKILENLEPPKIADVILRLNSEQRRKLFASSDLGNVAPILARLPDEIIYEITLIKGIDDTARTLSRLPVDEVADILYKLPPKVKIELLRVLPAELSHEVTRVMKFPPESVGGIMSIQIPVFEQNLTVGEALDIYTQKMWLGLYDKHNCVYIVDENRRLIGCIDVKTFLTKKRDLKLADCGEKVRVYVDPFSDREKAARLAIDHDVVEIPVVDFDGRFLGVVSLDDLLDVLVSEYSEDLLKYGGFVEAVKGSYITTPPYKLAIRRIPMLVYLYLINMITGGIVATFENLIQRIALLAAFMPLLADNSGNIGSQASAMILRGIVTGEIRLSKSDMFKILMKEFATTTIMIIFLAPLSFAIGFATSYIATWNVLYSLKIATIVAAALIASCYVSDIVGTFLPIILAKIRIDPAAASAPLVTSIGDVTAVTVYFSIASALFKASN